MKKIKIMLVILCFAIGIILILHINKFRFVPVLKEYASNRIFLYVNDNMGPVPKQILYEAKEEKKYGYMYKGEKEAGYIVSMDPSEYIKYKDLYKGTYSEYRPVKDAIKDELYFGENEVACTEELSEAGFSQELLDVVLEDTDGYFLLLRRIYIEKGERESNKERVVYIFFNESSHSYIHLSRQYTPNSR